MQKDGSTLRQHLVSAWKQTGVKPEELKTPKPPSYILYLWGYWRELHRRRKGNGFGPNPLDDRALDVWARPRGICLDLWEREAILAADDAYMQFAAQEAAKRNQSGS